MSRDTLAKALDTQARSWYPHMSEAERAEYVTWQAGIALD